MVKIPSKASVIWRAIPRSVAPSTNDLVLLTTLGVCGWELFSFSVFMFAGCSLEDCISAEPSYGIDVSYLYPTSVQQLVA